jgi:hypothetical protein
MADKKIRLLVQAEVKKAVQALNKVEKEQKDIKKQNDGLKKSFSTIGGVIATAFSIQAIARFTQESIKLGSQTISLTRSFTNLGKGIGLNEQSLQKFRKATDGTVSDVDLMIQANNAMLLGVVQNEEEFSELIDSAQRLAKAVGKDTLFGIESLTTGIGRQSRLMLDNLGIIVKAEDAYKAMALATGKSVASLTDLERKQAFITATMESVRSKVANLGKEELDASDATSKLSAAFKNLKGTIGKELQDEVEDSAGVLTRFIEAANTKISQEGILGYFLSGPRESFEILITGKFPGETEEEKAVREYVERQELMIAAARERTRNMGKFSGITTEDDDLADDLAIEETGIGDFQSAFIESFGAGEFEKTEILKAAALERQEIRREEELGEVPMSIFAEAVNNMEITEAAKTKMIEEHSKRRRDFEKKAHQERITENLEAAILSGQSAKEAAISVVKAEIAEAQAGLISSIMTSVPFPFNLALAAGAGSMIGKVTDQLLSFQTGGSFVTKGRTTLPLGNGVVVGDNASGMERIDVTPLPSPTSSGNNITINISAPLVDETVVDHIIPAIRRAEKLNL